MTGSTTTAKYPLGLARLEDPAVQSNPYINGPQQDVIGEVDRSFTGNTIIRTGAVTQGQPGWVRTNHIVLNPDEREQLIADLIAQRS